VPLKEIVDIGGRRAGGGAPCLLVAEIGPNHNGDPEQAFALLEAAAQAGCDAVKFQYHIAEAEIFDRATKSYYYDETRFDFIKRVQEFPHAVHERIRDRARRHHMLYLCSVFSEAVVERVAALDPDAFKLPSGEIGNPWLLERVAGVGKPIVASSGMSGAEEIDAMMTVLGASTDEVVLLHCLSEYPTALDDMHLRMIPALRSRYGCPTGLSDHSRNIEEIAASVALGCAMIEVHFTFDREARGPDHHVSLLPAEMAKLVGAVRDLERALGRPEKVLGVHAQAMRGSFTNSIVTRRAIRRGETLSRENLTLMKPATGLPASDLPRILGRRAAADLAEHVALRPEDFA
jgi:N,N'-diacetyllegionaminate synthase